MNIFLFIGVTVFYGMEKVSINCLMFAVNQDFQTTDLFMAYFGLRLSHLTANWRKVWVVLVQESSWKNFCHILVDILN